MSVTFVKVSSENFNGSVLTSQTVARSRALVELRSVRILPITIGVGSVGGMFIGTMIGILVIPTMFVVFQTLQEKIKNPDLLETESLENIEE